jgi:hypothetical protein
MKKNLKVAYIALIALALIIAIAFATQGEWAMAGLNVVNAVWVALIFTKELEVAKWKNIAERLDEEIEDLVKRIGKAATRERIANSALATMRKRAEDAEGKLAVINEVYYAKHSSESSAEEQKSMDVEAKQES